MVSAFADMEDAEPNFSSSAASQKAKFSPGIHTHTHTDTFHVSAACRQILFFGLKDQKYHIFKPALLAQYAP